MKAELLVFEVAGKKFSLDLEGVEEVMPMGLVTEIPGAPQFLSGLTAVRGKVMTVIDAAHRYGIGPALRSHFLICQVRGNVTAVAIGQPIVAGLVNVRTLRTEELNQLKASTRVAEEFILGGYELMEESETGGELRPAGHRFLAVNPDLFVSEEMMPETGEA